jgi:hypothetical protein
METTNTSPSKIELFDKIDVRLKKAKAITCLMAYAANEGSLDHGEELIWAQQVANGLIDEALSAASQLADIAKEAS